MADSSEAMKAKTTVVLKILSFRIRQNKTTASIEIALRELFLALSF
jgi:hypothetical protein